MKNKSVKNLLTVLLLRYSVVISLLGVIVVLVLGWFLLLDKPYQEISKAGSLSVDDKQEELELKKAELVGLKILAKDFEEISEAEFMRLRAVLPNESEIVGIYEEMSTLANEGNVVLKGIKFTPQAVIDNSRKTSLQKATVTLNIGGIDDFSEMLSFLRLVENSIHLLDLNTFNYSNSTNIYTLNFTTYYLASI